MDPFVITSAIASIASIGAAVNAALLSIYAVQRRANELAEDMTELSSMLKACQGLHGRTPPWADCEALRIQQTLDKLAQRLKFGLRGHCFVSKVIEGVFRPSPLTVVTALLLFALFVGTVVSIERKRRPKLGWHTSSASVILAILGVAMGLDLDEIVFMVLPWTLVIVVWIHLLGGTKAKPARSPADIEYDRRQTAKPMQHNHAYEKKSGTVTGSFTC